MRLNTLWFLCLSVLAGIPLRLSGQLSGDIESRLHAVRGSIEVGRYAEAEAEAETAVSILEGGRSAAPDVAQAVDLLVQALVLNGKGVESRTRALAQQVIQAREARDDGLALALSLHNLGDVLVQSGEYHLARKSYERAKQIRERALGTSHLDVAEELGRLAHALTLIEKYDEALAASDRALGIIENVANQADVRIARILDVRGLLLQRRGDYPGARVVLERAMALRERINPGHPETAVTLSLLSEQLRFEGNLPEAKEFAARAMRIAENTLRPDHPDIASYLRILAIPVAGLGDLAAARAYREHALAIAEKSLGSDHPLVAVQLNDLGLSLWAEGEYGLERQLLERALEIYERRLGPDYSGTTTEVYNLAIVSDSLGDFRSARRQYNRAISTWQRVLGPEHPFVAMALSEFARMLNGQGKDSEARRVYERALRIRERTLGKDHPAVARTLTSLSTSVAALGQIQRAYELSKRALTIWEQSGTLDTQDGGEALRVFAIRQASIGDYEGARASFDRSLAIVRRILGPSHPDVAEIQVSLATLHASLNQGTEARNNALEAEAIGRGHLQLMLRYLPEQQGLEYSVKRPKGLDVALSLAGASGDGQKNRATFDGLIRSRGLVLDEMAERRHASVDATRPDLAPLWATLVSTHQRFANLIVKGPDEDHPGRHAALLEEASRDKEAAERAFAEKSAGFKRVLGRTEIHLDQVRAALPSRSALVAFARYDRTITGASKGAPRAPAAALLDSVRSFKSVPSYIAFIVQAGSEDVSAVPLGSAGVIDRLVAKWRAQTTAVVGAASATDAEQSYRAAGAVLRRRVWDPLHERLNGAKTVFIVPDGTLNLVSLAALPVGRGKYLIDEGPVIHYLSAERDLVPSQSSSTASGGLLAVGGAAFDDASSFTRASARAATTARGSVRTTAAAAAPIAVASLRAVDSDRLGAGCGTFESLQFQPLAGTRKEIHEVASLWSGSPADILENRDANERRFKRDAPGHRVLHLATHGFFLGSCSPGGAGTRSVGGLSGTVKSKPRLGLGENPLLLSGLALAGANRRAAAGPNDEDGILTAEEVTALNLEGVEWAVLSACDTGLGEVKAGEGVFGLRRAFQVAGVRTVIMSLWPVDDQAARLWMRALYQGRLLRHLSTADAMHEASLSMLGARRARHQSTHPFYWAAFVAAGDWR